MRRRNYSDYEEIMSATPTEDESTGPGTANGVVVNCKWLSVRSSPDVKSCALCLLKRGDKVVIIGKPSDDRPYYTAVLPNSGDIGYIFKDYLEEC